MSKTYVLIVIAVAALSAIAWRVISSQPGPNDDELAKQRDPSPVSSSATNQTALVAALPAIVHSDGYLGSESCQECHEDYHQSWHTSYHRTMTQPVTPATAPASIINGGVVEVQGQRYKFSRRDDDLLVEFNDPIANGKRMTRRLVLMTGSHHMHVFWYESGLDKTPAQLQIMYYIDQQRWIPRKSAFLRPPDLEKENELGRWNEICCNCHATHPRTRPPAANQQNWDTRVSDFGITCEACHGPGEAHVAFHRLDLDDQTQSEDPIVNPMNLPVSTRSDMCGQCHGMMMVSIDSAADKEQYFTHGRQFRPGDRLDKATFLRVVRASQEHQASDTFRRFNALPGVTVGHFWPDGQLRVTGRDYSGMIESKCFQQGELSCLSCHTMHQQDRTLQSEWKDDQLLPNMRGDAACLQCHSEYQSLGTEHTHHPIDSAGSRCMNCHMPHTVYGILKSSRSHTISSPSVATSVQTGRPNACNLCHLDYTLEQTATHLADWYGQDKPKLTVDQQTTAASLLHLLSGDAAQRVLQFNAFQWQPAREASGTDWMRLYLLFGMDDPYDAIRLISERAYRSLPNAPPIAYDFLDSPQDRGAILGRQFQAILNQRQPPNAALMIGRQGLPEWPRLEALMSRRDHRPVYLQE